MATFYALPSLTVWATTSGWSLTSGGTPGTTVPGTGDDVVFDANSGPSRTITTSSTAVCNNITTVGANAISLSGTSSGLSIYGPSIDLSGFANITNLTVRSGYAGGSTVGTANLKTGGCTIGILSVLCTISLASDLVVTNALNFNSPLNSVGNDIPYDFFQNGFNVTSPDFIKGNAAGGKINFNGGMFTITNGSFNYSGNTAIVTAPFTVRVQNTTSTTGRTVSMPSSADYANLIIESTGPSGSIAIAPQANPHAFNSVIVKEGSTVKFNTSFPYASANWVFAGSLAKPITVGSNTAGTAAQLQMTGPGPVYLDACNYSYLNCSPANIWIARAGTSGAGNTGITPYKARPNFLSYF